MRYGGSKMDEQKRKHRRIPISAKIYIDDQEAEGRIYFYAEDLSLGGVYLKSDFLMERGDWLDLYIQLPEQDEMKIKARVVWVNLQVTDKTRQRPAGMGLEFEGISNQDCKQINDFLADSAIEIEE